MNLKVALISVAIVFVAPLSMVESLAQDEFDDMDFGFIPEEIIVAEKREALASVDLMSVYSLELKNPSSSVLQEVGVERAAVIAGLNANSIASKLSLQVGDVIMRVGDHPVLGPQDVAEKLKAEFVAGKKSVSIGVTRISEKISMHVDLPFPSCGERYSTADGAYGFQIPEGWFLVHGKRNTLIDEVFDSIFSPDVQTIVIVARNGIAVSNPVADLKTYENEKLAQARAYRDVKSEPLLIAGSLGFRVSYLHPTKPMAVSRFAFVSSTKRYVINVVMINSKNGGLSEPINALIESIAWQN